MTLQVGHYKTAYTSSYWPSVGKKELLIGTSDAEMFSYTARFSNSDMSASGTSWGIASIAIGRDGNDTYNIWGSNVYSMIADSSKNSTKDSVNFNYSISRLQHFFSIEGRHAFVSTYDGGFSVIVDALNSKGKIESITFSDLTIDNGSDVISSLLAQYKTKSDQSFDQLIQAGFFNPAVMGVNTAQDVRLAIDSIYTEFGISDSPSSLTSGGSSPSANYGYSTKTSTAREFAANWLPVWQSGALSKTIDFVPSNYIEIEASSWKQTVKLTSVTQLHSSTTFNTVQADLSGTAEANIVAGSSGSDQIWGKAGWDIIDGASGNDLIHGGNGRDILTGGLGRDEIHGDFGWNTYKSEKDGYFADLIAVKSDEHLTNWIYGKAGNNPNGEKADIIEGLDSFDQIKIIGVFTPDLTFKGNATAHGMSGIGIFAKGALEALYTGGDLSVNQIQAMTTGDGSASAMANQVSSYGWAGI